MHWLLLSGAIGVEIVATTSLKLSDGLILLTYGRRYEPFGLYARVVR